MLRPSEDKIGCGTFASISKINWFSLDATGYNFGPDMRSATEEGKWVSHVYQNPESGGIGADYIGTLEHKHMWVMRHDISADEFTKCLVFAAVSKLCSAGLEATIAYFTGPESVYSGLAATIDYCNNSAETSEGE